MAMSGMDGSMSGMSGMSGGMDGDMGGSDSMGPLSPDGVDFSNITQASDFLADLLNDDELKIVGNAYARYFWYGISVIIAIATAFNFLRWLTLQLRLRDAARNRATPARPKSRAARWFATVTAIAREATYLQFTPTSRFLCFRIPPLGTIILLVTYLGFVLALEFINNHIAGAQYWQALGVRAAWLAVAQVPLLVLLIGKFNLIGLLTGVSYERLNVLHRWTARMTLLLAIFHFGFQSYGWQKYGIMQLEWATDSCPPTGIAAFALLLWMNLSTLAPIRYWSYDFFVVQHIITFFGFIIAVMYHLPSTALWSRIYIYIPIALYLLDRLGRTALLLVANVQNNRASLTQLDGNVTKIRISSKGVTSWRPGAHVLLSIPRFGIMQSHPATICSTPRSHNGDLMFILKGRKGFTKRIYSAANDSRTALLPSSKDGRDAGTSAPISTHWAIIDGPYGGSQSDFAAFHSVALIAGSTGVTFTLALLQDLADRVALGGRPLPVRQVLFVWCVKSTGCASWIRAEIAASVGKLAGAGIDAQVSVFVTCADAFTDADSGGGESKLCGCACDQAKGPCCCVAVDVDSDKDADMDEISPAPSVRKTVQISEKASLLSQGRRLSILPCATFYSGRPEVRTLVRDLLEGADGESGVAVCGPIGLNSAVRNAVVGLSDERAIHKGTGAQGCYLHVEAFS